jgi:ankyrin repeat protein
VSKCLAAGADPNAKKCDCSDAPTVLNLAIEQENVEIVRVLIASGANPSSGDLKMALCLCFEHRSEAGAEIVKRSGLCFEHRSEAGAEIVKLLCTAGINLDVALAEFVGTARSDEECRDLQAEYLVKRALDLGASPNATTSCMVSPSVLSLAVRVSNAAVVRILLSRGANPTLDKEVLYLAIEKKDPRMVSIVVAAGAVLDRESFASAITFNRPDVVSKCLAAGADPNAKKCDCCSDAPTFFDYAAQLGPGHAVIVKLLLKAGARGVYDLCCDFEGCSYKTKKSGDLTRHQMTHSSGRTFSCTDCQYSAMTKAALKKHMRNVHGL